jgi:uncharacterized damage-inducible protein DinB
MLSSDLASLFARDLVRLRQQVAAFETADGLWAVTWPGVTNSAGNLVLHLEGNLREYVGRQMGGIAYERDRPLEFSAKGESQAEVLTRIEGLIQTIPAVIRAMSETELNTPSAEQRLGAPSTNRMFLLHLYSHFSYHLGQIDIIRRQLTGQGAIAYATL